MSHAASDSRRALLVTGTMLATLMYTVDSTIVNVALPHMQGSLQATQDQISWVVTSYIVLGAIATPLAGWLASRFGVGPVLLASVTGFTLASMLCGIATDLAAMVVFRGLQGAFGASLVPVSQVAMLQEFPRSKHGKVMGLWTMGIMIGPIMGPSLGGYLTDHLSWRWTFFINAPIGVLALLGLLRGLRSPQATTARPFDWLGFVMLSLALGAFQMMLDRGQTLDWFESGEIIAEACLAALMLYMFVVHMRTSRHPFVDPSLFADRNLVVSLVIMFTIGLSVLVPGVLLPSFLQSLQGYTPTEAGQLQAIRGFSSIAAIMLATRLSGRVDPRILVGLGLVASAVALLLLGRFAVDSSREQVLWTSLATGIGTPLVFVPLSLLAYATVSDPKRAEAGVLLTLARNIGSSIGVSMAVAMLARSTQINHSYMTERFTPYDPQRWEPFGGAGSDLAIGGVLNEINRQSAAIAYSNDFRMLALVTLLTLPLVWLLRTRRS